MSEYNIAERESSATTDDCTDLPERAARALTEKMTVLPEMGRAEGADGLYLVVTESGSEYLVDARTGACECPDYQYREPEDGCKHIHRVAYATGEASIPAWVDTDAIDSHLGIRTDATPLEDSRATVPVSDESENAARADGGTRTEKGAEQDETPGLPATGPTYTYHREPAHVGGARYLRCTGCGIESVLPKPDTLIHRDGCPEVER